MLLPPAQYLERVEPSALWVHVTVRLIGREDTERFIDGLTCVDVNVVVQERADVEDPLLPRQATLLESPFEIVRPIDVPEERLVVQVGQRARGLLEGLP